MPEVDESVEVNIDAGDLRIDTYRASGSWRSACKYDRFSSKNYSYSNRIVVTCQRERSQLNNRETAMKMLKSKLIELEMKKKEEE